MKTANFPYLKNSDVDAMIKMCINDDLNRYIFFVDSLKYSLLIGEDFIIITLSINNSLQIDSLTDLNKLEYLEKEGLLKLNKSKIARELNVDCRTVDKYIHGFQKSKHRRISSPIDLYYEQISHLLSKEFEQLFFYKKVLWQYLKDNSAWIVRKAFFEPGSRGIRSSILISMERTSVL